MNALRVAIAGGGWAGLAAALELAEAGCAVTVLEAAPSLGGRARSVNYRGARLDNGQHLAVGGYRETLALMRRAGIDPDRAFHRRRLVLAMQGEAESLQLRAPLPGRLGSAVALLGARGLGWGERLAALRFAAALGRYDAAAHDAETVTALLARYRQSPRARRLLWEPLCLAALNTPAPIASARVFAHVVADSLGGGGGAADLLFPAQPLGALFAEPLARRLAELGATIHTRRAVRGLRFSGERLSGVDTTHGPLGADAVILALPHSRTRALVADIPPLAALARDLAVFEDLPIATVYLDYPRTVSLGGPMRGLVGTLGQWLIDRDGLCGERGRVAAVISGPGPHDRLSNAELGTRVAAELNALFPDWPEPASVRTVRERRATYACTPAADAVRPPPRTALPGLWLSGDYVQGPYPATLEGAVCSGVQCARQILAQR